MDENGNKRIENEELITGLWESYIEFLRAMIDILPLEIKECQSKRDLKELPSILDTKKFGSIINLWLSTEYDPSSRTPITISKNEIYFINRERAQSYIELAKLRRRKNGLVHKFNW